MGAAKKLPLPKIAASIAGDLQKWEDVNNAHVAESVRKTVNAHAEKVAARARELVPVKSGLLKSTIRVTQGKNPLRAIVKTDHGKAPHDYLVHFGTVKMEGRPFLYQASEALAADLPGEIKAELGNDAE
jgi:HK97 gp10 family phage protein